MRSSTSSAVPVRLEVFAVEDSSAQLSWAGVRPGALRIRWDGGQIDLDTDGGPGTAELGGLVAATTNDVEISGDGWSRRLRVTTLASPPGAELFRFATISDLHLGREHFGLAHSIREHDVDELHPTRCARSAIDDLTRWGAQRLVVKGDIVDARHPEAWDEAALLLQPVTMPVDLLCGNHDRAGPGSADPIAQSIRVGLALVDDVVTVDVPGLRLVMFDSAVDELDIGRWHHAEELCVAAVATAPGPAMLLVHHHPQPLPFPIYLPRGIPGPIARRFVAALTEANPAVIGTSGHTHRNRRHNLSGIPWTEVGSTKDYPGVWAGYVVHEGGIRQVVRRVSRPDCLVWTERTRRCAGGLWGYWSKGSLDARCFTWRWPTR